MIDNPLALMNFAFFSSNVWNLHSILKVSLRYKFLAFYTIFFTNIFATQVHAYTITSFNPSVYTGNVEELDTSVGIADGYIKENFSDGTLIPGLTISFGGNPAVSVLDEPCTDTGSPIGDGGLECSTSMSWDSAIVFSTDISFGDAIFTYGLGTDSIGVGIGDVESDVEILVNGFTSFGLISDLSNYNFHNEGRDVYLRIDAEAGDAKITELRFVSSGGIGDGLRFDRLAIAVPIPASIWLFGSALVGLIGLARRKA